MFAEVDETEAQYFRPTGMSAASFSSHPARFNGNTDIMPTDDDYTNEVPAAFRSPGYQQKQQQQIQNKPSFGLRQQSNINSNQQLSPSVNNKGSIARKLPIRPATNSSFVDGNTTNNNNNNFTSSTPRGNNNNNNSSINNITTPRERVVTFTQDDGEENTNNNNNRGDTESRVREMMLKQQQQQQQQQQQPKPSFVASLFSGASNATAQQQQPRQTTGPSFLSGMYATKRNMNSTGPQFDEEESFSSPPPPISKPPVVIQSAERQQRSKTLQTEVIMPTVNFAEYEHEDEQSPPRVPPGLTPTTQNNNNNQNKERSSSFSPKHQPQYYKNLFSTINNGVEPDFETENEEAEQREQSLESALGIRAILNNNSNANKTFGRRAPSLESNNNNSNNVVSGTIQQNQKSFSSPFNSKASSVAPNAPRYTTVVGASSVNGGGQFEEIDDSPPGVAFSEFLPPANNATTKNQEQQEEEDDEDYSPIKSSLYHDPYLLKSKNNNKQMQQEMSPAMDRLRFGYAAASTSLNSPSGNSKSVTFHHHQQHQNVTHQYYDPANNASGLSSGEFAPKAAVPIASLLSAGRSTSPASSMDAVLGQRTAAATKQLRQQNSNYNNNSFSTSPLSSPASNMGKKPFTASNIFAANNIDDYEEFAPSAANKKSSTMLAGAKKQTSLQLLQSNMQLNGEDDRDIRNFVRNLKDERGKPVKQISMSPERLNRNTFLLPTLPAEEEEEDDNAESPEISSSSASSNENEETKEGVPDDDNNHDLPPPSAFTIEKRRRDQEEAEYQKILRERDDREQQQQQQQLLQQNNNTSSATAVAENISHHSPSVVAVRVQVPTVKIPIPQFEYHLDISPATRELQRWPIDRTPRSIPDNVEMYNHPSVSPSHQKSLDERTSSARRRQQAIDELTRPITSLQRKRLHEKFYSNGTTVEERTIYIDKKSQELQKQHEQKYSHSKIEGGQENDDEQKDDEGLSQQEMDEFAPRNGNNNKSITTPRAYGSSARADSHKAYLALRSKQASRSAFFTEGEVEEEEQQEKTQEGVVHDKNKNNTSGFVPRDHPSPLRNISHVSPSKRFSSPNNKNVRNDHNHNSSSVVVISIPRENRNHLVRSPSTSHNPAADDVVASIRRQKQNHVQILDSLYSPGSVVYDPLSPASRLRENLRSRQNGDAAAASPASSHDSALADIRESGVIHDGVESDVVDTRGRVENDADEENGNNGGWSRKKVMIVVGSSAFVVIVIILLVVGIMFL